MHKYRSATFASRSRIGKQRFILVNNYCHCYAYADHKRTIYKSRNYHKSTLHRRWEIDQMCNINPTGQTPVWFCKDRLALPWLETKANCGAIFEIDLLKETTQKHVQYCRVPKNGLPKNGQAGISPKNKNDPGWKNELRTVHHTQRAFAVKTTSSAALLGLRTPPLRRFETFQPHSTPSMRRHIPFARYKLTYVTPKLIVK